MRSAVDRFRGCLVGCAVGDALAMPVEGLSRDEIAALPGGPVDDFRRCAPLVPGQYTDDTQMALVLAGSILACGRFDVRDFAGRLAGWMVEGGERGVPARRPDDATTASCVRLTEGVSWHEAGEPSAGCAAAVRACPIGLLHAFWPEGAASDARLSAVCTHTDPRAAAGAVAVAVGVAELAGGASPLTGGHFINVLSAAAGRHSPEVAAAIEAAAGLLDAPAEQALGKTGTGAFVVETLPAAVYCFLKHPRSFEAAVLTAANAGGAACSIASIVGAWAGAHLGLRRIPHKFVNAVESRDALVDLADGLHRLAVGRRREVSHV